MGGDNDNVDDSGNTNDIDEVNDNINSDGSEVDVGGDTYDDGVADENDVAIYHAAYTADADNSDVSSNANKYDANDADNDHDDEDTKDGNNVGMDEFLIPLMILALIMMMLSLMPKMLLDMVYVEKT